MENDILKMGERLIRLWKRSAIIWLMVDYAINILAFICSISVVYIELILSEHQVLVIVLSILSAALTFVCFTINPKKHTRKYRKAFSILNHALLCGGDNGKEVREAIDRGEKCIDDSYDID